jgi:hypothetical protein
LINIPKAVTAMENLRILNIGHNPLKSILSEMGLLTKLQQLHVDHCQITSVPDEIGQMHNLEYLNLYRNSVETLPGEIGNAKNLRYLNFGYNPLKTLPNEIENLKNMEKIFIMNSHLQVLPRGIGNMENLAQLVIINSQLSVIPEEIENLQNLQFLSFYGNQIEEIPETIIRMANLQILNLGKNKLAEAPSVGSKMRNLQIMDLSENANLKCISTEVGENVLVRGGSDCPTYRYVMVRREKTITNQHLNLAEVEVYSGGINIASGKTVTASSVYGNFAPSLLTDGNRSNLVHTNDGPVEWFKIDLGESSFVDEVVIYNRRDCCKERAENIKIHLSVDGTTDLKVSDPISKEQAVKLKFTWKPQEGTSITAE